MYTRWVQWAAFSGVLRSHDRGMSGGSCAKSGGPLMGSSCSIVRIWVSCLSAFDVASSLISVAVLICRKRRISFTNRCARLCYCAQKWSRTFTMLSGRLIRTALVLFAPCGFQHSCSFDWLGPVTVCSSNSAHSQVLRIPRAR